MNIEGAQYLKNIEENLYDVQIEIHGSHYVVVYTEHSAVSPQHQLNVDDQVHSEDYDSDNTQPPTEPKGVENCGEDASNQKHDQSHEEEGKQEGEVFLHEESHRSQGHHTATSHGHCIKDYSVVVIAGDAWNHPGLSDCENEEQDVVQRNRPGDLPITAQSIYDDHTDWNADVEDPVLLPLKQPEASREEGDQHQRESYN